MKNKLYGNAVRVFVHGVPVPLYLCSRSPISINVNSDVSRNINDYCDNGNWGYVLQSCWAVFTSFKMPLKGRCCQLEDDYLSVTTDSQVCEIERYNRAIQQIWI